MSSAYTTLEEALTLLDLPDDRLFAQADALRREHFGNRIDLCAIINARSGNCSMNCAFCSQSRFSATDIPTFPFLDPDTLTDRILALAEYPVAHIGIVTSGAALNRAELDRLLETLDNLPEDLLPRICTSLGRLDRESLQRLKDHGVTRYHHNLECAESFYPEICQTQKWQSRKDTVVTAGELGLTNCTGGLFGMGETPRDRISFALTLRELHVEHVPMNFLHPHPHTPLAHMSPPDARTARRIIAMFRHILPTATLRICGGRPTTFGEDQAGIFSAGANALMIGDYLTTSGMDTHADLLLLKKLGLTPSV